MDRYDVLRAALRVVLSNVSGGLREAGQGRRVEVGLMALHADDCGGSGPLFAPDFESNPASGCSQGAYILQGFTDISEPANLSRLLFALAALPDPGRQAPWMTAPWRGHPYKIRDVYLELYRYLTGGAVFNGFLGTRDYGSRLSGNLYHTNLGDVKNDVLLDLHSFHAPGEPFLMLGPQDNTGTLEPFAHAAREQALALRLGPRRIVEGWLETYADGVRRRLARTPAQDRAGLLSTDPRYGVGTTEYMRSQGGYALTLECGQHQDPAAPEVAWRAIHRTLAHLRLIDAPAPEPVARPQLLRLAMVVDKHHADDRFVKTWSSYDPVARGETIGMRHDGTPVQAKDDGFIVFPNAGASAGNEWFYFAQPGTRDLGT